MGLVDPNLPGQVLWTECYVPPKACPGFALLQDCRRSTRLARPAERLEEAGRTRVVLWVGIALQARLAETIRKIYLPVSCLHRDILGYRGLGAETSR